MMSTSSLFHPLQLGPLQLPNRIVMAVSYTHLTLPTNREV